MAQKNSHEVNKVLKNAAKSTKYTAKQIFSDKTPYITGTVSSTLDAMRDIREWGRQNNPFKATNGNKDPLVRQILNTSKRAMKDAKKDFMSGDLTFKRLNKTFRSFVGGDDMFGGMDFDLDLNFDAFDNYEIVDGDEEGGGMTTATAIIGMGENLSNDFTQAQFASASATIGAIEESTNRITSASATITSAAVDRIVATNMMTTTRLSTQLGEVHGSLDTINQNIMSIVEHNNEMNKFISQSQTYMEHTEQSLNDIKALLGEMASVGKKEESFAMREKPEFLDGRFDIKKYMKFVMNDSAMGVPLSIGIATAFKALKLTPPSFIDSSFAMPLSDILPLKTMTEKLLPAVGRIGDLDKTIANAFEIFFSKMSKGEYGGIFNMLGMFGMGVDRFNKTRFRSDGYEKGTIAWNGKSERALQEVIPDYLSNIESYLNIISRNTETLVGTSNKNRNAHEEWREKNRRIYDYAEGEFITNKEVRKKVQKGITDAVQGAFYDSFDQIGKLMNGSKESNAVMQEFLRKIMKDEDSELSLEDLVTFQNIIHDYRKDDTITNPMAGKAFEKLAQARADAIRESGKVRRSISSREMIGAGLGDNINKISAQVVFDSKENLEQYKINQMTPQEREEYERKKREKENAENARHWFRNKVFGTKDSTTGTYSGTEFSKIANAYINFQKNGTAASRAIDYANDRLQDAIVRMTYGMNPWKTYAHGSNSLPQPGLFVGNTGERIESIPVKQRVDNFVNLAEAFGQEARDIRIQLNSMGKNRGIGFADGTDSLNSDDFVMVDNGDGTFNITGKRGGHIGTLDESGLSLTNYGKKARAKFNKVNGKGSFNDLLNRQIKANKFDTTGNKAIDNFIQKTAPVNKPQTVGEQTVQDVHSMANNMAIIAGAAVQGANNADAEKQKEVQSELSKDIFGEKDENGFYKGKFLSDFANTGVDFKNMISHAIDGKGYTTSAGVKIADSDDSISKKFGSIGDKALQTILGADYKDKKFFKDSSSHLKNFKAGLSGAYDGDAPTEEDKIHRIDIEALKNHDEIKERHNNGESAESIAEALGVGVDTVKDITRGVFDNLFGGSSSEDIGKAMEIAQAETDSEAMKMHDKLLTGVKGGLIGLGAGMVGAGVHGIIPSLLLPGGPIGGAVLGISAALLSKNDKFMNWMFGEKDDAGIRAGGLISKDLQEKFKITTSKLLGPAAVGAIGGLIFPKITSSLGIVGSTVLGGGPIGGALLGIGASMLLRSKAMNELWYGEDGDGGLKKTLGNAKKKAGDFIKSHSKNLAAIGIGAGAGALLGTGLIGYTMLPAVLGGTIGLASSSRSFTDFLLGTRREKKDKDGNVIGIDRDGDGLIGKVARMVSLNVFTPLKRFAKTSSKSIAEWFRHDILWEMKSMFSPFKEATTDLAMTFKELSEGATKVLKKVFNPLIKFGTGLAKAGTKLATGVVKGSAKIAGHAIAAPFKILGGLGRALTGRMDRTREAQIDFRYGGGTYDRDAKWENQKGIKRIFNPLGRTAEWGLNSIKHGFMGAGQFLTGMGDGAFAKASLINTFGKGVKAYQKTNGGVFEKLNAFGSNINPFNVFDKERQKYAEDHGLTGNAAFMNPIEKRRHKRKAHEIKLDDKDMKRIEKRTKKWAKQDGYNDKIELTDKEFKKRRNYFSRMGYDVSDIKNSSQLMELMYDPLGSKTKDKMAKDSKQEKAEDATIESKSILESIQDAIENMYAWMTTGKDKEQKRDDDKDAVRIMKDANLSAEEISDSLGLSTKTVRALMGEIDEDKKKETQERRDSNKAAAQVFLNDSETSDMSLKDIARQLNLSPEEYRDLKLDFGMGGVSGRLRPSDISARQARGMDKFMDNAIDKISGVTGNILAAPALGMSKLKDKLQGIDPITRKNIINDISSGMSESDIAAKYGISAKTVKRIISEEDVRNAVDINTGKMEGRMKKAKTNANEDGEDEEETPTVNAVMTDEDGKPIFGKKSFLGKIFGSKGALATIGTIAIAGGVTALLVKFPEIIDFTKNTLWPLLRDVVWPTLKSLLTGIGAAILGTGKFIKSGQDAVGTFLNFCSTGKWQTEEERQEIASNAAAGGLTAPDLELKYLTTPGGFAEVTKKDVRDLSDLHNITNHDILVATYVAMGNEYLADNDSSGDITYQTLSDYINKKSGYTDKILKKIASARGKTSFSAWDMSADTRKSAMEQAISYMNGEYGFFRFDNTNTTVGEVASNVGNGVGYGHFMQTDPRWANKKYAKIGNGRYTTIANGGCGPTALANVAIQNGIRTNPAATASLAQRFGYTSDGGSTAGLFTAGARRLGLNSKAIGAGSIRKALSSGKQVVFAGKGRGNGLYTNVGHILSARGLDGNGNAIVDDPMRRNPISVPISKIGSGITHAWSIGRGDDDTDSNESNTIEYDGKTYDIDILTEKMKDMMENDALKYTVDNGRKSFIYYQLDDKWKNVILPRIASTIGLAGCVESAFGSLLANITGLNYRPPIFAEKFRNNDIRQMLQNALPPSLSGVRAERYGINDSLRTGKNAGRFTNNTSIMMVEKTDKVESGSELEIIQNAIKTHPFVIYGGASASSVERPDKDVDVFYKGYKDEVYNTHALLAIPSLDNNDRKMSNTNYYILNPGTQNGIYQGLKYNYKTLFNPNQGIESIFFLNGLNTNMNNMPGLSNTPINNNDAKWLLNSQDAASVAMAANTTKISTASAETSSEGEKSNQDESFLGTIMRRLGEFGKIIWGNLKSLITGKYESIYDGSVKDVKSLTRLGGDGKTWYNYESALDNASRMGTMEDTKYAGRTWIDYNGKQIMLNSLTPEQLSAYYYGQEQQRLNQAARGSDGTITYTSEAVESNVMGSPGQFISNDILRKASEGLDKSPRFGNILPISSYSTIPSWAKKFNIVSPSQLCASENLPTSNVLSADDISTMVNLSAKIIASRESGGDYSAVTQDTNGYLALGISGFNGANAAEIFTRMADPNSGLSEEDRILALQYAERAKIKTNDGFGKIDFSYMTDFLKKNSAQSKNVQDAFTQQLQFNAFEKIMPLMGTVLNDPRSAIMIAHMAPWAPAVTSRFVEYLKNYGYKNNPNGEFASVTQTMDSWYSQNTQNYKDSSGLKLKSGFRRTFKDIYEAFGGDGGRDAVGFGGGVRDSYYSSYPTAVDTPVAINTPQKVEVETPYVNNRLDVIISYLRDLVTIARNRPVNTSTTAATNLDIGHGLANDQTLQNAGIQRKETLPIYTEGADKTDRLKSIHNRIARSPRPV